MVERLSIPKKHFTQYKTTAGLIITQRRLITGPPCENTGSNPPVGVGVGVGGGVLSRMANTVRLRPKRVYFSGLRIYERVGISLVFKDIKR